MIACSNCSHENLEGSIFCAECGAKLPVVGAAATPSAEQAADVEVVARHEPTASSAGSKPWANLHLLEAGHILPLSSRPEFTLGRISEGQPIVPDVDLSPYQAFASGVSRLHAIVRHEGDRIAIIDLGSANGTFVNGTRLPPNSEQYLGDGDIIALGKLRIQLLLHTP
jgi:hypothetical protein